MCESNILFWWLDAGVTPVLIPNTEVKLCSADDTRKGKVGSRQNKVFDTIKEMNEWSIRRKRLILSLVFVALVVLVGLPLLFLFYQAPNCFDGKQNGDETGLDCGGSCQLLCTAESLPLLLKGDPRIIKISDNTFEVLVLIENPNPFGEIYRAGYTIRLYDTLSSVPVKVIEGNTHVPKGMVFSIFEGPINLAPEIIPTRATFEWKAEDLVWQRNDVKSPELVVTDLRFSREDTAPRLDAVIRNVSLENVTNIDLAALVSNDAGNVFAASKTFVDSLPSGATVPIVFSWPAPFSDRVVNTEIIIRIFPDRSFVR